MSQPGGEDSALAVECQGVTKKFGKGETATVALKGVDFEARYGDMTMVVGPSGCGKTTLLSLLCGTLRADSGSIHVFGRDITQMKDWELTEFRRTSIGFIFQQFNLIPTLTAAENVSVPLLLAGWSTSRALKRAAEVLDQVGLGDRIRHRPTQLSGGQQQRVAIARALVHKPRLIISDEPTAALDAATGQRCMELMREVATGADRCVIVVTHDNRIFHFADRIVEMEDGQIRRSYRSEAELVAAYSKSH
jgi:putative ABC transport system ATP-binding protein